MLCADVRNTYTRSRFYDNGWYIGHDEPSIRFLSSAPGSGDNVTYDETLGTDPAKSPTVKHPGTDVTHYFELTPAPWFSMSICDPNSYPLLRCTPQSDSNAPRGRYPGGGNAFLELQFYPPGYACRSRTVSVATTLTGAARSRSTASSAQRPSSATTAAQSRSTSPSSRLTEFRQDRRARNSQTSLPSRRMLTP